MTRWDSKSVKPSEMLWKSIRWLTVIGQSHRKVELVGLAARRQAIQITQWTRCVVWTCMEIPISTTRAHWTLSHLIRCRKLWRTWMVPFQLNFQERRRVTSIIKNLTIEISSIVKKSSRNKLGMKVNWTSLATLKIGLSSTIRLTMKSSSKISKIYNSISLQHSNCQEMKTAVKAK